MPTEKHAKYGRWTLIFMHWTHRNLKNTQLKNVLMHWWLNYDLYASGALQSLKSATHFGSINACSLWRSSNPNLKTCNGYVSDILDILRSEPMGVTVKASFLLAHNSKRSHFKYSAPITLEFLLNSSYQEIVVTLVEIGLKTKNVWVEKNWSVASVSEQRSHVLFWRQLLFNRHQLASLPHLVEYLLSQIKRAKLMLMSALSSEANSHSFCMRDNHAAINPLHVPFIVT